MDLTYPIKIQIIDSSAGVNKKSSTTSTTSTTAISNVKPPTKKNSTSNAAHASNHESNKVNDNDATPAAITTDELIAQNKDVDPFLIRKWEHIFSTFFDVNFSREVDWGDFYLVVRRVRDVYGAESVQYTYARKTLEALWKGLCRLADADDDELISMEEWIKLMKKSRRDIEAHHFDEVQFHWFNEYQNFMFKLFDVSQDGFIDVVEYVDGMSIYGYDQQECVEAFRSFAFDSSGVPVEKVNPEQWRKMFLDLFFAGDPSLVGNNLFGKIKERQRPPPSRKRQSISVQQLLPALPQPTPSPLPPPKQSQLKVTQPKQRDWGKRSASMKQ